MTLFRIDPNGSESWAYRPEFSNVDDPVRMHRLDGPAVILPDGSEAWMQHGKYHRKDGPAIISCSGREIWYYINEVKEVAYIVPKTIVPKTKLNPIIDIKELISIIVLMTAFISLLGLIIITYK